MSCSNYTRRLLKLHGWDTLLLKLLPPEMVPSAASYALNATSTVLSASESNNTPSVSNLDEKFQKASSLKSLKTKTIRKTGTCANYSDDTYGLKNNQDGIDVSSMRGSATRKQKATYSASHLGSANDTGPSVN